MARDAHLENLSFLISNNRRRAHHGCGIHGGEYDSMAVKIKLSGEPASNTMKPTLRQLAIHTVIFVVPTKNLVRLEDIDLAAVRG